MSLKLNPINMVLAPNSWANSNDNFWTVTDAVAIDLWGILTISDALGTRPYVPASGAVLQAVFQRGDYIGSATNLNLSVTKTATLDSNFRALVKIAVIASEATNIVSGTIVFTLTETINSVPVVKKWSQNWSVKKLNTSSGF